MENEGVEERMERKRSSLVMRLKRKFFQRDVLVVAPDLLGKILVRKFEDGREIKETISEVEAYRGEEDLAAHARFGRTKRNEVMYGEAGKVYMYLIYGMYWMFNVVTGNVEQPQAVLIRSSLETTGPGRLTRKLELDKSFYGEDLTGSKRLWIEKSEEKLNSLNSYDVIATRRIGVDYAKEWAKKEWRFVLEKK